MDNINSVNSLQLINAGKPETECKRGRNSGCFKHQVTASNRTYSNSNVRNNHIMNHVEGIPDICEPSKHERLLPQELDPSCRVKSDSGPSTWQRRDSFSSCSSDSTVYCSSRHTQVDAIAQDVMKRRLNEETIEKKRHRNSSGSSALSSASDSSNKDVTASHVSDILSCLKHHSSCSGQEFPQISDNATSNSKVSSQSSVSHYPSTVTSQSEIATIVEEKTVSYRCKSFEKSVPTNERHHNLRQKIRKKTCHNCDCNGSHTTVVVRRFTSIKRATTTTTTTKHNLPKAKPLHQILPPHQSHLLPKRRSPVRESNAFTETTCASSSPDRTNRKRRTEVDKLYDALHEIQWAKHISPDNILSQIDFRRAAKLSFYSNKNKPETTSSPPKIFKSPLSLQRNHLNKDAHTNKNIVLSTCTYSANQGFSGHNSAKNDSASSSSSKNIQQNNGDEDISVQMGSTNSIFNDEEEKLSATFPVSSKNGEVQGSNVLQIENLTNGVDVGSNKNYLLHSGNFELGAGSIEVGKQICSINASIKGSLSNVEKTTVGTSSDIPTGIEVSSSVQCKNSSVVNVSGMFPSVVIPEEISFWNLSHKANTATENSESISSKEKKNHSYEGQLEQPCVRLESLEILPKEEDVIIECLHPDIIEIETSDVCFEQEVLTEEDSETEIPVISPSLPRLTKVTPVTEHSSEESPPHLEPCNVTYRDHAVLDTFEDTLSETECHKTYTRRESSDSEGLNQSFTVSDLQCPIELVTPEKSSRIPNSEVMNLDNNGRNVQEVMVSVQRKSARNHRTETNLVKKKLFKKYFKKSKTKLKDDSNCSSAEKSVSSAMEKDSGKSKPVQTDVPVSVSSRIPHTVSTFSEIDKDELIKNDSLRVRLRGIDQLAVRNHLKQYKHIFQCKEIAHQSVTCSKVETSETKSTSSKCVQFSKKRKLKYKGSCQDEKSLNTESVKNSVMPLEYKKDDSVPIPFNFTIHYRFITVNKNDGYTQVIFKLTEGSNTYLTAEALNELRDTLYSAGNDSECHVLIVNSMGRSFCLGLDLSPLLGPQKNIASKKMAVAVKDFIEALAAFSKPLVVVVNGAAVGLGVTMLAYSDVIISSDAATFHMPYSKLGFCPEGGATLMLPFVVGSTVAMDMLLRGRSLSAYEAYGYGLVTEVLTASQLPFKLVERVRQLAESPSLAMESTKSMLRMHLYQRLTLALESETAMLPKQWLSESCQSALQKAFKNGTLL